MPAPPPPRAVYVPECTLLIFFTYLTPDDFNRQWGLHTKL